MRLFIRSDKDPDGKRVCVENAFQASDGKFFLLLRRLPPEYAKAPLFLVELSGDRVEVRVESGEPPVYHKAYAFQCLNPQETKFLLGCSPGKPALPFLNFSYPNLIRILGKQFHCLSEAEAMPLVERYTWKLVGGLRK